MSEPETGRPTAAMGRTTGHRSRSLPYDLRSDPNDDGHGWRTECSEPREPSKPESLEVLERDGVPSRSAKSTGTASGTDHTAGSSRVGVDPPG